MPAKDDLRGRFAEALPNPRDRRVSEDRLRPAAPSERVPALHGDPFALNERNDLTLLIEGVNFVLHERRARAHLGKEVRELLHVPVREPDRAHKSPLHRAFERAEDRDIARARMMENHHVDIIQTQFLE